MIVKMIQNPEIKMESQINNLETRIEKMQERFKQGPRRNKKESIYNKYILYSKEKRKDIDI